MNAPDVYRVIGVRRDKSRRVICRHVTESQAQRMKTSLDSSMIFPSVEIEAEANVLLGLDESRDVGQPSQPLRRNAKHAFVAPR
jgi:hypothetical protein